MPDEVKQQYTYQVGKTTFIVTPKYREKEQGETMADILLKLMKADIDQIPEA